ncbi:Uncharacterised protein [uncultured Blautia sp.]|nr:Uncharacterised protein [uncultured Blautia sp.]
MVIDPQPGVIAIGGQIRLLADIGGVPTVRRETQVAEISELQECFADHRLHHIHSISSLTTNFILYQRHRRCVLLPGEAASGNWK